MISCDTECSGLYLQNGDTCFSIGAYDGHSFRHSTSGIDPIRRCRLREHNVKLRKTFDAADLLVFHNAHFDMKALCESGLYDWNEPNEESFWKRVVDTTILAHLHCSTDLLSLDILTRKYLGKEYPEDDILIDTVTKCRTLVRTNRCQDICGNWCIAETSGSHPSFKAYGKQTKWNRMDFWLPAAVRLHVPEKLRPKLSNDLLESVMLRYLKADCVNTFELAEFYFHQLLERHGDKTEELLNINKQVEHITWKMEITGLWVRPAELEAAQEACHHYIDTLKERTSRLSGLDHITDAQLRTLFFEEWGLEPIRLTKTGAASVDAKCLLALHEDAVPGTVQHDFLGSYLSLKKYEKKLGSLKSYHASRSSSGYTHPSFNIVGTKTTRFSSKNPNAQNITKAGNPYEDDAPDIAEWLRASPSMRSCFGPPPDMWWLSMDYSQLQLRIFAVVTNEQEMIDAFNKGWDAHDFMARKIFNVPDSQTPSKSQRRVAKNVNFGFVFGASPRKIEQTAGIPGLWDTVTELFPNAHAFIEETKASINQIGYVETVGGYPLELKSHINKWTGREEKAAHAGVNYIVQGAEGVIVKRAMKLCDDYLVSEYPEGRIALQVHDEIDFEVPVKLPKKHVRNLKDLMESAASQYGIHAPVEASLITHRWDKEVKILL